MKRFQSKVATILLAASLCLSAAQNARSEDSAAIKGAPETTSSSDSKTSADQSSTAEQTKSTAETTTSVEAKAATIKLSEYDTLRAQALITARLKQWDAVEKIARKLIELAPTQENKEKALANANLFLGNALMGRKQYGEAEKALTEAKAHEALDTSHESKLHVAIMRALGLTFFEEKKYADSQKCYEDAAKTELDKNGDLSRGYGLNLAAVGVCKFYQKQYTAAERDLRHSLQVLYTPDSLDTGTLTYALDYFGQTEYRLRKFEEAENTFKQGLSICQQFPADGLEPKLYRFTGWVTRAQDAEGHYAEAEKTLRTRLADIKANSPTTYPGAMNLLAEISMDQGKYDDADKAFDEVVGLVESKGAEIPITRMMLYREAATVKSRIGKKDEATKLWTKALDEISKRPEASGTYADYAYQVATFFNKMGEKDKAQQLFIDAAQRRASVVRDAIKSDVAPVDITANVKTKTTSWCSDFVVCPTNHKQDLNKEFLAKLNEGLSHVPLAVRQTLANAGIKIMIIPTMADIRPEMVDERPRGYSPGETRRNEQACHMPDLCLAVMAQKFENFQTKQLMDSPDVVHSVRHELAHTLDDYLGSFSDDPKFIQAYADDTKTVFPDVKRRASYYLQAGRAGRKETFAQVTAILWGSDHAEPLLRKQFPKCFEVVKQMLDSLPTDVPS